MEYVKSEKGKEKLLFEGFVYEKQKNLANGVVSFECEKRPYSNACKVKVKVFGNQVVGRLHERTHGPDSTRREVIGAVQEMKTCAEDTEEILLTNHYSVCFNDKQRCCSKIAYRSLSGT